MVKVFTDNRTARYNYHVLEVFEAGIVLTGAEVKSIRNGKAVLKDGYACIEKEELFLLNVHVSPYEKANNSKYNPEQKRKLLMHKGEIRRLSSKVVEKGLTLIPLRLYLNNGRVKVELGLVKGKRKYDKREDIKKREVERDIRRDFRA